MDFTTKKRGVKPSDLLVTTNQMVFAKYSYEANEEKLIYIGIINARKQELDKNSPYNPQQDWITVTALNYAELTAEKEIDLDSQVVTASEIKALEKTGYIALKRIYEKFRPQVMEIKNKGDLPKKIPMINELSLDSVQKSIRLKFHPEFVKHFYALMGGDNINPFNKHRIRYVTCLKSNHAQRLYRILNAQLWKERKVFEISLEDLKYSLDIENKPSYAKLSNLKDKVIDASLEKINEQTNLFVKYENIKNGQSIIGFRFILDYTDKYKQEQKIELIEKLKLKYLKNAIPFSDDGKHFRAKDRAKYIVKLEKLTSKQIKFLVQCPEFLNDYGTFYNSSTDTEEAKEILSSLLKNNLERVQEHKLIDFDYYVYLQAKKGIFTKSEQEKREAEVEAE